MAYDIYDIRDMWKYIVYFSDCMIHKHYTKAKIHICNAQAKPEPVP